jgi:flagellar assembly protein FliH
MSSRLLRAAECEAARPIVWPSAGRADQPAPPPPEAAPEAAAARQVAEIRALAERQVREAREAAWREGEAAGRKAAEADLRPVLERLTRSIEEIAGLRPALLAQAEAGLVKLAVAIARRVLHREISLDPDALAGVVRAALEKVRIEEVSRVRAHPAEAGALRAALERTAGARGLAVEADASLERGSLIIETSRGRLDASVDTQLAEIERGLADRLRRHA